MYKILIRPLLFLFPPEQIHQFTVASLKILFRIPGLHKLVSRMYEVRDPVISIEMAGLTFPNRIGLAAGFDKEAELVDELSAFGFGFIEIGTVTPRPQPGNQKPRLFRLKKDQGLINRMGFNNQGVRKAVKNLAGRKTGIPIGGNIGKNKSTDNAEALRDYLICLNELYDQVDYFVVNVSSPNTPNLRALQEKEPLRALLENLRQEISKKPEPRPLFLKIAPDLSPEQLDDVIGIVNSLKLDGVVATNTTISREGLLTGPETLKAIGEGGLSGKPLKERSNEVIKYLRKGLDPEIHIIGVGGIMNADDVVAKLEAGASVVQLYTGFIYEGPGIVKAINQALAAGNEATGPS